MKTVSKELYLRLLEDRPFKLNEEESNYRKSDTKEECGNCSHFFERVVDEFHTCEVVRKLDDSSIEGDYVCNFWTDGKESKPKDMTSSSERD
jgi:tRNA U54 and U55 pseudouridine synthase Pus10